MPPNDRDRGKGRTPAQGVPRDFLGPLRDEDLTPVTSILRLEAKLDNHQASDEQAIAGVHDAVRALDTRLSQQITDVGSVQTKLLTETAGQTVMLETAVEQWKEDRRARAESIAAANVAKAQDEARKRDADEKRKDAKMDRRSKISLAIISGIVAIVTAAGVHIIEHYTGSKPAHAPTEPSEPAGEEP